MSEIFSKSKLYNLHVKLFTFLLVYLFLLLSLVIFIQGWVPF